MNVLTIDGIKMAQMLWSPTRNIVRQMILPEAKAVLFSVIKFGNWDKLIPPWLLL